MKKALLVQLPVPGFLWPFVDANIPLAAGYLASWAKTHAKGWAVEILPWQEADLLGDEALFHAVLRRCPDLVGLSLYLWNSERSLALAGRLMESGIPVLVGGPEVLPDNPWLWKGKGFSGGIVGEGEEAFSRALAAVSGCEPFGGLPGILVPPAAPGALVPCPFVNLAQLPSPYLSGILPPSPDGSVWLETLRGCPFHCAYCHYGKRYDRPESFPSSWLSRHLVWAAERGCHEVYLMDPSFNVRSDWEEVLKTLEQGNPDGRLALHAELVADTLRSGDGRRLARVGLASCEIGLQSVRDEVLLGVGRRWNRARWTAGVRELLDEGISVVVGVIIGLPGDSPSGYAETLEFLLREAPGAQIQVFPLALLPGTDLRARASKLGIEALSRPPYTVTRTPGYEPEDLAQAFELFEESTGLEIDPLGSPGLTGPWEAGEGEAPYLSGVRLSAEAAPQGWPASIARRAARNLTLWVRGWGERLVGEVAQLARLLPHGVLTVILEDVPGWPAQRLRALLAEAGTGDHYLDRHFRFLYGAEPRIVPRLVALVEHGHPGATPRWAREIEETADVFWALDSAPGWMARAVELLRAGETVYARGEVAPSLLASLSRDLGPDACGLLFASSAAQLAWDRLLGNEGFRVPEHRISLP